MGTEIIKAKTSEIGCATWIPVRPNTRGKIIISGIKKSPLLSDERKDALPLLPTLWNSIFEHTESGWKKQATHWH